MILSPCESSRCSAPGCGTHLVSCPPQRYEYGATLIAVGPRIFVFDGSFQSTWYSQTLTTLSANRVSSCLPPPAIMMFGAPAGGRLLPSMSALLKKFTFSTMMHCSVAGLPCSIACRSATHACFCVATVGEMRLSLVLVGM